jgi:hypothetical protein
MTDRSMTTEQQTALEDLVDACGLEGVLYMLADVCADKAEHINHSWQDQVLARRWLLARTKCSKVGDAIKSLMNR